MGSFLFFKKEHSCFCFFLSVPPPPIRRAKAIPAGGLQAVASFIRHIRPQHLLGALFPDQIPETKISRPVAWM